MFQDNKRAPIKTVDAALDLRQLELEIKVNLLSGIRTEPEYWTDRAKLAGFESAEQLSQTIVAELKQMAAIAKTGPNDPPSGSQELASRFLDICLFGKFPAERVSPVSTPYGGMAKGLEVAHRDRVKVYDYLMELRAEILSKW